jgi:hypothetical protein
MLNNESNFFINFSTLNPSVSRRPIQYAGGRTSESRAQVWHGGSRDPLPGNNPTDIWVHSRFYSDTGLAHEERSDVRPPDKAAFCRARQKLPLDLFSGLFSEAVSKAQEMAARIGETTWCGFRVLAVDGTKKVMPYSEQLEAFFGIPSGASFPQMLACALYDVLAKIPLNVVYGPFDASERDMARLLYKELGKTGLFPWGRV